MAALGVRPHSGWAMAVVVTGPPRASLRWRDRVELLAPGDPGQPWHVAADRGIPPAEAAALHAQVAEGARQAADTMIETALEHGATVVGVVGAPQDIPPAEKVLGNHLLLHLAEGELFRSAIEDAGEEAGLPVVCIDPKALPMAEHDDLLAELGRAHGRPWRADHKQATVAALLALQGYGS